MSSGSKDPRKELQRRLERARALGLVVVMMGVATLIMCLNREISRETKGFPALVSLLPGLLLVGLGLGLDYVYGFYRRVRYGDRFVLFH